MKPVPMPRDEIECIDSGMCGEREFSEAFAEAIIAARDKQWQEMLGEPTAYMCKSTKDVVHADEVGDSVPNWTDYYTVALYAPKEQK